MYARTPRQQQRVPGPYRAPTRRCAERVLLLFQHQAAGPGPQAQPVRPLRHFDPDTKSWVAGGDDATISSRRARLEFYSHWLLLVAYEQVRYEKNSAGLGNCQGGQQPGRRPQGQVVLQISL